MVRNVILLFAILAGLMNSCSAGIIVSFASTNPNPIITGSSGTMDVLIHSNAGDVLDGFLVDIAITPVGGSPAGGLQFSATQNDAQLGLGNYVFFGRSLSENTGAIVGSSASPFNVFSGSDFTDDGSGIPGPGIPDPVTLTGTDLLLFRLDLTAFSAGTYSIDLLPSSQFGDDNGNLLGFSSTPGSIIVNGTAAVPEPGSVGLLSMCAGVAFCRYGRRRKTHMKADLIE